MPCHLSKIQGLRWQGVSLERGCLAHREIADYRLLQNGHPFKAIFTHPVNVSITSMLKPMNTRKIAFSTPSQPLHGDLGRKEGSLELRVCGQKDLFLFLCSITSNNSSYAVQEDWEGSVSTSSPSNISCSSWALPSRGLATESDDVRKITSSQSTSSLSFSADAREKGRSLSNSSARSNCEPHDFIRLRASAAVGLESREADGCPSFLEKRDRRELSFFTVHADFSLKDIACVLLAQTKDAKIVCVIGCQITRTRIHTLLKRLASPRHDNREKTVLLPDCTLQTNQSVKTKDVDDVFSRCPLYCGSAGSDVIGCRRPTGGVLICMLQTRVTLMALPIGTPGRRSSKFPWRRTG